MRDHQGVVIDQFNGLWRRGEGYPVPNDHFFDCDSVQFPFRGVKTRDGIDVYQPYSNVVRMYTFIQQQEGLAKESLLILNNKGQLYDTGSPTPFMPILTLSDMKDFGYVSYAGRAYINPHTDGIEEHGVSDLSIYVYRGNGIPARPAGGAAPDDQTNIDVVAGGVGNVEPGMRIYSVAYETDTGFITVPGGKTAFDLEPGAQSVNLTNIQVSPDNYVVARWILVSTAIKPADYTGNVNGYELFFFLRIPDNTTTAVTLSFFDAELISSADYLNDLFNFTPSGVGLTIYHGRMITYAEKDNISLVRISAPGQPEAFDQVNGLIVIPLDGHPITNAQEYRDVLYIFKQTRTYATQDNQDVPSSWPIITVDEGIGAAPNGIATVLDSGGVNIEYLLITDFSGIMLFDGRYTRPELSWKIRDLWFGLDRNAFRNIQFLNDTVSQILYIVLPGNQILVGDYKVSLDPEKIKWTPWTLPIKTSTIALINYNELVIGSRGANV